MHLGFLENLMPINKWTDKFKEPAEVYLVLSTLGLSIPNAQRR